MGRIRIPDFLAADCCSPVKQILASAKDTKKFRIALAGNANVGKSALFNHLTGLEQHVANWPGKTVELAEGGFIYNAYHVSIVDLPGIYSLSTFSKEEDVTRDYITSQKPDIVINVIDSCNLERNLFFTLQLFELGVPVVIALNQTDLAKKHGIIVDEKKLSKLLGVPVVKTVATSGVGVYPLIQNCIEAAVTNQHPGSMYTKPKHRSSNADTITKKRYTSSHSIAAKVLSFTTPSTGFLDKIDYFTTHPIFGYFIMLFILASVFYIIFTFGAGVSGLIGDFFNGFRPPSDNFIMTLIWEGVIGGFVAGVTLVLPYVLPFYLLVTILEDTGYLTRVAYLLDCVAHRIGFHGKAVIPLILGYGCNVPACMSCRIMEYERDRLITAFAITLIPCTARTVVVLALVGAYLGPWWALGLYAFNLLVIMILSKIAFKILPGEPMGLIMEIPPYRIPKLSAVLKHTWWKIKSILSVVFPYYMVGGFVFALAYILGVFTILNDLLAPITVGWLGLPAIAATLLIFGVVRKEFIVVLPAILYNTTDLSTIFTPVQMVTITIIALFYLPCFATIEAMRREYGWKNALFISIFEVILALVLGGLAYRVLSWFGV